MFNISWCFSSQPRYYGCANIVLMCTGCLTLIILSFFCKFCDGISRYKYELICLSGWVGLQETVNACIFFCYISTEFLSHLTQLQGCFLVCLKPCSAKADAVSHPVNLKIMIKYGICFISL